jgi:HD-like signal output (HDOD) protein
MGNWWRRLLDPAGSAARADRDTASAAAPQAIAPPSAPPILAWQPRIDVDALAGAWLLTDASVATPTDGVADAGFVAAFDAAAAHAPAAALVPRVPSVVPQLLQTLRDPAGTSVHLSRQVARDPLLVAAVLRLANSPLHGVGRRIASLEQALLVIGHDGLRQLLASVAFKPIMNLHAGDCARRGAPRVWDQSERSGMACHLVAPLAGQNAFEAFLAALLQNVGLVVALRLVDQAHLQPPTCALRVGGVLCERARRLACRIGREWSFPAQVIDAIAARTSMDNAPARTALADVLRVADTLAWLRVLADANVVAGDDPACELDHHPVLARGFAMLDAAPS